MNASLPLAQKRLPGLVERRRRRLSGATRPVARAFLAIVRWQGRRLERRIAAYQPSERLL
jgi:hypothetical protein